MFKKSMGLLSLSLLLFSCQQGPTVLEEDSQAAQGIFEPASGSSKSQTSQAESEHRVFLMDTLSGSRYSYLKVREGDKEFWLATLKRSYTLEEEYIFEKGIYKTDYYSTAFDRSFDEIYLVSDLRPAFSQGQQEALGNIFESKSPAKDLSTADIQAMDGAISIKELIENADSYVDQEVKLTAKVVKINANIMDRHWLHLKDGSMDQFDLVATSQTAVPAGHTINLKATLRKSVDFGAGYSYDLILENAEVLP